MSKICIATTVSITQKSFILPTAAMLSQHGNEVVLVCDYDCSFKSQVPEGVRYYPICMSRGVSCDTFAAIRKFRKLFKEENFDLVQYSTPNASLYASIAAKAERVPVRLYCQWGIRYVGMNGLKKKLFRALEKITCSNSTAVRAASYGNMRFAINEGLYGEDKAGVVGNGGTIGVDLSSYDISQKDCWRQKIRLEYGIPSSAFLFGFSGRLCADKGCEELLVAFKALREERQDVYLIAVGPSEDMSGIPSDLIEWSRKDNRVIMVGQAPNRRMREFYAAMDVLIHPTYREGFGMVIQEAGALAVPVITTNVLGASEVMVDGDSCVLVPPRDSRSLYAAMARLANNKDLAVSIGNAAWLRTKKYYERGVMLDNQMKNYRELLNDPS